MKPVFNPLQWKSRFLLFLLAGFVLIWIGFFDDHSLLTRYQLQKQHSDLKQQTELLQAETKILEEKIEALENDPAQLERIAREEYGMRRPGEVIYEFRERR